MLTNNNPVKVSVLMLTYKHEKYVRQALEGALAQQTRFPFEIVVADDCSPDGTEAVLRKVAEAHPGRVRFLPRERNLGICRNFADGYAACGGEYVAVLEGDDVWHHPHKLQRLADALDHRRDASFVFHNVRLLLEGGGEQEGCCPSSMKSQFELTDFLTHNFVPNCSALMFRHRLLERFPDWLFGLGYYDWPLHVLHLEHGPALYIGESLSTYRIHHASAWHGSSLPYRLAQLKAIFNALNGHLGYRYESVLKLNERFWQVYTDSELTRGRCEALEAENARLRLELAGVADRQADRLRDLESAQTRLLSSRAIRLARSFARFKAWCVRLVRRTE